MKIDATWHPYKSANPALEGFKLSYLAAHRPDRASVDVTLVAERDRGKRFYRVVETLELPGVYAIGEPQALNASVLRLDVRMGKAVSEYEAANPVQDGAA